MRIVLSIAAAAMLLLSSAQARVVTIDFESATPGGVFNFNYVESGFRFSPDCHFDMSSDGGVGNSQWIGFDASACFFGESDVVNPDFLGPDAVPGPQLYVDFGGGPFSLLELTPVRAAWILTSSNGGMFMPILVPDPDNEGWGFFPTAEFSGPEWTDIRWLLFRAPGVGDPVGFDNFVARVPVPATLGLIALGIATLGIGRAARARSKLATF